MSGQDEIYKQKYLKYKAKYLELKRYEQEGGLLDSGFGMVFTSKANAAKLREAIAAGKIGGKGDIADLLDRQAYIVFDGKKPAELLESTSRIMKDKLAAAAEATKSAAAKAYSVTADVASKAATATADLASKAASATAAAAVAAKDSAMNQYNKYQEQKQKEAADKAAFEKFKAQQTGSIKTLFGGADLPLTIPTLDGKSFDRANEAHKKHIAAAVAAALGLDVSDVANVSIKFKMFGKPELRD